MAEWTPDSRAEARARERAPDLTRLWNDAEAIYEREFPEPRAYFGVLPILAKVAYFERAAIEAIERAMGAPHHVRCPVVSVVEMRRYERNAARVPPLTTADLLEAIEWKDLGQGYAACPSCECRWRYADARHAPGCALHAALVAAGRRS